MPLVGKAAPARDFRSGLGIVASWQCRHGDGRQGMGSYLFERTDQQVAADEGRNALRADVESALRELDWVEDLQLRDVEQPGRVYADVHFDPDWPDTANPDIVAEVFLRYGLHVVEEAATAGGKVMAADPLRASAAVDEGGIDLFVFDED